MTRLDVFAQDQLFKEARTYNSWREEPLPVAVLHEIYELARFGPTSINCNPIRVVFVRSSEAKERLRPALRPANVEKTMAAPVTTIIGFDTRFFDTMPRLFPHDPKRGEPFAADPALAKRTAFRNGTLQGAYLIVAARALGLDCGPMSGFDHDLVDSAFFPDGTAKSNFLLNLGYGNRERLRPRLPRLAFEEACAIV